MRLNYQLSFKQAALFIMFGAFIFSSSAHATFINFDDLDETVVTDPLTDEYAAQGVIFQYGAYLTAASSKSSPNYVVGPGFTFSFIGQLPTYVSFYTGSSTQSKVFIDASGPGYSQHKITEGEIHGLGDLESTPYIPNQFISFSSSTGISLIELSGQSDGYIDDLTFYYSTSKVPEPSTLLLFVTGFLGMYLRKYNQHNLK